MTIFIITLFPEIFQQVLNISITGRAQKKALVEFQIVNLREFGSGRHQVVDGKPYGGGAGMVFKADILAKAINSIPSNKKIKSLTILMSASGVLLKQQMLQDYSKLDQLIIVCGHYEGVDQRFIDKYIDLEISIGDFVLTGGEIPALAVCDGITRLIPGVLEKAEATINESFSDPNLLEHPQYTRPEIFEGQEIPKVLLSGHHGEVDKWRKEQSIIKTQKSRPDLLKK